MKEVVFLSGLPRTGSTVLASMLNQHPDIHATTTSPVADLVSTVVDTWPRISRAIKNPDPRQYGNIITGVLGGSYAHIQRRVVVDKNRLWPRLAPILTQITRVRPKIICTVRSIPDIMASYILLVEANAGSTTFIDRDILDQGLPVNNKNRCRILLEKYINHPYQSLRIGYNSGSADMLFLEYNDIVASGQRIVDTICDFIGCNRYTVDASNLQSMDENDEWHGGLRGLHDIRRQLAKTSPPPSEVIGRDLVDYYSGMKLEFWRQ